MDAQFRHLQGWLVPVCAQRRLVLIDQFCRSWRDGWTVHAGIRADVAHERLSALGYAGSERTTPCAVAEAKTAWRAGRRRLHRPGVPEPGMWFRYDFGHGPTIAGVARSCFVRGWLLEGEGIVDEETP